MCDWGGGGDLKSVRIVHQKWRMLQVQCCFPHLLNTHIYTCKAPSAVALAWMCTSTFEKESVSSVSPEQERAHSSNEERRGRGGERRGWREERKERG